VDGLFRCSMHEQSCEAQCFVADVRSGVCSYKEFVFKFDQRLFKRWELYHDTQAGNRTK
jgi:hypothetical protein